MKGNLGNFIKIGLLISLLLFAGYMISEVPHSTAIDFSSVRRNLGSTAERTPEPDPDEELASSPEGLAAIQSRNRYLNESRAREYVESATTDYYHGSYEEALRRLERARIYDPSNYSIFKLSGQIFYEKNKLRKAFNDWERANQLPNDDRTISRDLDVLRRLIRYSRTEMDRLQRTVNREPDNRVALARQRELEEQMRD
jgi:tetratricopeptide (TPR) repeat protein